MSNPAFAGVDLGDPGRPADLIFIHANGFNGRTYRTLLEPLAPGLRILAPDLRGHGGNPDPALAPIGPNWRVLEDDLLALIDRLDGPPLVLAGHSMGATLALLVAARAPERVRALALLDPVILPRAASLTMRIPGMWRLSRRHPWARAALRRRSRFADKEAAFQSYQGRGSFRGWPEAVLRDYVEDGFRPVGNEVELACAPAWESSNYAAQANDTWGSLARIRMPVAILKAERGSTCSVTEADAARRPNLSVRTLAGGTHFFPMTDPDPARALIREMAG